MSAMERLVDTAACQLHKETDAVARVGIEIDFERRFGGIARLYGAAGLARFRTARVCVVGVGGVGSWAVEALARSAIGHITMIDLDNVAESNINRQLHALSDTLGMAKVSALAARIGQINPFCEVVEVEDFLTEDNLDAMLATQRFDYIIDAIDNVRAKAALIAWCRERQVPLITIGAAGGQLDPTRIEIRDLARTEQEPLLAKVRKRLRAHYRFPRGEKSRFGIDAVFSTEPLRFPVAASGAAIDSTDAADAEDACAIPADPAHAANMGDGVTGLNCAGFGSSVAVTASFGLAAAARVLQRLAQPDAAA
ncbi:tRNA threonylcarbamoyladenosine dehydratase [Lacisediminimonas sp.]|uniref:tRNA threonylcarbamoyladenosine dehydratase n=1 Tax=Lacisediminimonas sp. TaxID=3060582 RepID=UPI00271E780F|nr:tRNA threonylcarbamoyladenosine dehydratase [Lacisediminimonas sp.]MDO8300871.1 tRNA threonylcarbamoyladenosine dehydratase [Lacisediminimonas sp.]